MKFDYQLHDNQQRISELEDKILNIKIFRQYSQNYKRENNILSTQNLGQNDPEREEYSLVDLFDGNISSLADKILFVIDSKEKLFFKVKFTEF